MTGVDWNPVILALIALISDIFATLAFYTPAYALSKTLATNIVKELNIVCPIANTRATPVQDGMAQFGGSGMGEIREPANLGLISVLAETNFHDNPQTAQWIIGNKDTIARAYTHALADTFGIARKPTLSAAQQWVIDQGIFAAPVDWNATVTYNILAWTLMKARGKI